MKEPDRKQSVRWQWAEELRDLFVENPPIEEIVAKLYGEAQG